MIEKHMDNLNIFLLNNDFRNKSNIEIYNQWISESNIRIKKQNFSFVLEYIEKMKNVDKDYLKMICSL